MTTLDSGIITHKIPKQEIDFTKSMGINEEEELLEVPEFDMTNFISFGVYKEYLKEIKKDSSTQFYNTQLPDSSMCLPDCYVEYVNNTEFDNHPVLGISWEAAMHYAKWMTIKENTGDEIDFIYRLPTCVEWLSAYTYLGEDADMNHLYADWLLNTKFNIGYAFHKNTPNSQLYNISGFPEKDAPQAEKRRFVIGNSFLFQKEYVKDFHDNVYYQFEGYRHIPFRLVKTQKEENREEYHLFDRILKYWGLEENN